MTFKFKRGLIIPIKNSKKLFFTLCLFVSGTLYSQNQMINLPKGANTIQIIFQEIERQTNLSVDYNQSKLNINKK